MAGKALDLAMGPKKRTQNGLPWYMEPKTKTYEPLVDILFSLIPI